MRDAWKYLLDTAYEPVTLEYFCKLNEFIARNEALEWGRLRTETVGISGTDYMPQIPELGKAAMERFNVLPLDWYNTGDNNALKEFLYENAVLGMAV